MRILNRVQDAIGFFQPAGPVRRPEVLPSKALFFVIKNHECLKPDLAVALYYGAAQHPAVFGTFARLGNHREDSAVEYENVIFENTNGIGLLTLNRPDVLNSLSVPLMTDVRAVLARVAADPECRALVMTGAGPGFCAGADLASTGSPDRPGTEEGLSLGEMVSRSMKSQFNPLVMEITELEKPVIAAVNGVVAGGGVGLALAADIVIACRSSYFVQVFGPKLGIVPDMGCTWHLPRLVGRARALGLALTGEKLPSEKAAEWGLIWKCVDDDKLMQEVMSTARRLADGPFMAHGYIKRVLAASDHNSLPEQLDLERMSQRILCDSADFVEGVTAFLTKRKPEFKGR